MMQSRLGGIAKRSSTSYWVRVLIYYSNQAQTLQAARGLASTAGRTADPAVHAGDFDSDPQGTENVAAAAKGTKPPYPPGSGSSSRLESRDVPPLDPTINQQKRSCSHRTRILEEVSCAGLDGSPWPRDKEEEQKDREEQQEYYKHHKASPLAEIEFADTRNPITRATDATADAAAAPRDVIVWRPEQLDTAEDALERARRIWKHNAIHGDPDAPHSRVLRALRGESF